MAKRRTERTTGETVSAAWRREIERRIRDADDPRRYVIKSVLIPRARRPWEMFYNISEDVWAMDVCDATLFKRRKAAQAIAGLFDRTEHIGIEEVVFRADKIARKRTRRASRTAQRSKP